MDFGVGTLSLTWNEEGIGDGHSARQQGRTALGEKGRTAPAMRVEPSVGRTRWRYNEKLNTCVRN